jgi:predicted cupin superfamily sugar epimerase
LIERLGLEPHPEGGWYRQTYRAPGGHASLIYFLLRAGERSEWHRVAKDEIWLYHAGDPLRLRRVDGDGRYHEELLGLEGEARPQRLVPAGEWQSAVSTGWTLVGCMVAPAFDFADFELATVVQMQANYPDLASRLDF